MEIVFTASDTFVGRGIRYFTKRSWLGIARVSHAAIRWGGAESNWMVESNQDGVVPNRWKVFEKKRKIYKRFEVIGIDENVLKEIVDELTDNEYIYRGYDFFAFIGFGLIIVWYWITGKRIKNFFGRKNSLSCSELVYRMFKKVEDQTGIKFFEKQQDIEAVFPESLLIDCENNPEHFREIQNINAIS